MLSITKDKAIPNRLHYQRIPSRETPFCVKKNLLIKTQTTTPHSLIFLYIGIHSVMPCNSFSYRKRCQRMGSTLLIKQKCHYVTNNSKREEDDRIYQPQIPWYC